MKKLIYGLLALIIVLFVAVYVMLFTSFGNAIVANFAQNKVKQSTGLDLNISKFILRFSSIDLKASLANMAQVSVEGNLSLFRLGFDLNYIINLDKKYAQSMGIKLDKNLEFIGKIEGRASDFMINGKGYFFGSNTSLDARVYNYSPIALNLNANNIELTELLALVGKGDLASGKLDISSKISAKDLKPDGNIIIKLDTSSINYSKIEKEFNINLPVKSEPKLEILANIKDDKIYAISKIYNDYLNFQTQKTLYDITQNSLNTDFDLKIPNLAKLEKLTKLKLNGNLSLLGDVLLQNFALTSLNASILGLGGDIKTSLKDNKLQALINNANLEKLVALAGYGGLLSGNLNANLTSTGLDFANFDSTLKINNAKLNKDALKKLLKIDFPNTNFNLDFKANSVSNNINYNGVLASNLINVKKFSGTYNLTKNALSAEFNAFVDDLSKFSELAGQKLSGNAEINANARLNNNKIESLNAKANLASGTINAVSNGKELDLNIDKIELSKLFVIAGMPNYSSGVLNAKGHLDSIDFTNLSGNLNLDLNGVLNEAVLSKILEKKFPSNTNYELKTRINLKNNIANFDTILNSTLANLSSFKGSFNLNDFVLDSNFILELSDFSKLGFLLDRKLKGSANFTGKLGFNKALSFDINSKNLFNGNLAANMKNNILNANLNNVDLSVLASSLDFMDVYQGKADVLANYNLLSEQGEVNLDIKEGRLKPNLITNALKVLTLNDITNDVYKNAKAKALINKENIKLDLDMQANRSYILIKNGALNSKTQALNMPFDIKIDRANFKGSISGTMNNPKVKLDAGSVVNSIKNVIGGKSEDGAKKAGEKVDKAINKLLNKIF